MTGKERVAYIRRRKAKEKIKNICLYILNIIITAVLIFAGLTQKGALGQTLLSIGTILLEFNYLILLWNVPMMLKMNDSLPMLRRFLFWITGTDNHKDSPRVEFFRCVVVSLMLTATTIYILSLLLS